MRLNLWSKTELSVAAAMLWVVSAVVAVPAQTGRPRYSSSQTGGAWAVPEGTVISMRMDATLTSRTSHVGDKFTATVAIPVYVNGRTVIPAGSVVEGQVTSVTPAKRMSKSGTIAVDFDDLILPNGTRTKLTGTLTSADPNDRRTIDQEGRVSGNEGNRKVVFIGGGGAIGAVLGGIAARSAGGAVLGGVLGAGAGLGAVLLAKGEEAEVRAGTPFGIQLTQALNVGDAGPVDGYPDAGARGDRDYQPPADRDPGRSTDRRDYPDRSDRGDRDRGYRSDDRPDTRTGAADPDSNSPPADAAAGPATEALPLSSPEMIRRAQSALRDQGYYEGEINGTMGPRTSNALRSYQRDHQLNQTGELDPTSAKSLGILGVPAGTRSSSGASGGTRTPSPNDSDIANPRTGDSGYPRTSDSRSSDSRTGPPYRSGGGNSRSGRGDRDSYGDASSRDSSGAGYPRPTSRHGAGLDPAVAATLSQQAEALALSYQRALGITATAQGVQMARSRYDQSDIDLLFALNDFVNAARLYGQLAPAVDDPAGQRQVVLALAREARHTDRVMSTTSTQAAAGLAARWDNIRQDVLRLMDSQNITASDIEER